jgi:iron(III) transport system substrate-binding protein
MPLQMRLIVIGLFLGLGLAGSLLVFRSTPNVENTVVVYTTVDSEFALPLFEKFTQETGIVVIPRTDGEAVKTTAMAERLIQMRLQPDGDLFWNSELSQMVVLAKADVFEPYESASARDIPAQWRDNQNHWTGFGCRVRVIIYNTQKIKREDVPTTVEGIAQPRFKNRVCIAKPLFGTTRSHLVSIALAERGEKSSKEDSSPDTSLALFRAWKENGVTLVEGNGDVRNRVAEGSFDLGLTDSDDVFSAMERGKPVDFVVPDQTSTYRGAYMIPNTVALLKNAKHTQNAKKLIDFLLRPETEKWLAENGAKQIPTRNVGAKLPIGMEHLQPAKVDVENLGRNVLPVGEEIYRILK